MSLRKIRVFPDPILRKKCKPVKLIDNSIKKLALDMVETLGYLGGVGLAANQVGVLKRVVTLHLPEEDHRILVNPEITKMNTENFIPLQRQLLRGVPEIRPAEN